MVLLYLPAWPLFIIVWVAIFIYFVYLFIRAGRVRRELHDSIRFTIPPPPPNNWPPPPPPEYTGEEFTSSEFEDMRMRLRRVYIYVYKRRKRNHHYRKLKQAVTHRPVRGLRKIIRFEHY